MSVEVRAMHKNAHISAQKVRTVANAVRGLPVGRALAALSLSSKKAARVIEKVVKSAVANAEQNNGLDVDNLLISTITVNQGEVLKRYRPKGMGRMRQRFHRHSHVIVAVSERS